MRKIFAADFGAGNTCLFYANPDALIREALELNNPGGEPSGYANEKNGDVLLGLGLFKLTYDQLKDVDRFHINIKAKTNNKEHSLFILYLMFFPIL